MSSNVYKLIALRLQQSTVLACKSNLGLLAQQMLRIGSLSAQQIKEEDTQALRAPCWTHERGMLKDTAVASTTVCTLSITSRLITRGSISARTKFLLIGVKCCKTCNL